ncbi:thiamine biosynthetic bifunctional enzyme Thi4 [Armillaria luteobubalina]|uniref:Thiamine biosynthetic bifunctional enzyme Thi4 n=1 Tax=Armillaria luteobubalina TaxID=153913 RepID=A0AA39QL86_9AGAR|nr:thiamine biosynthetic bifunctional enzyme Thi4 [Armillaria luteobubalina]
MTRNGDNIDYSLYLVTGRDLLPHGMDYLYSLEQSLIGGVTVVQIREKTADAAEFLSVATASKTLCDKYNVPLFINDRIDIALAVGARGVHLGQTDMPVDVARKLLPPETIIGVSCNTLGHVEQAVRSGADYVGIGAIYGTQTKKLTSPEVGVRGIGPLLQELDGTKVKAVAIGGIKQSNLLRTLHRSVSSTGHSLDGVAVVSEIVASRDPKTISEELRSILNIFKNNTSSFQCTSLLKPDSIVEEVIRLMGNVKDSNPLIHQITNTVVSTQSANITLALGASPIMAFDAQEMEDIVKVCGACLINIGTLTNATRDGMLKAGYYANRNYRPVVLDPVGVGASAFRKDSVQALLNAWQPSVIKGNAGELGTIAGSTEVLSKGVDSVGPGFEDPISFVRNLARKERCIVVLTGTIDYISDGFYVIKLSNGDEMLGKITGSGCIVGSCVATYCSVANSGSSLVSSETLWGAVGGVLVLTIAAEVAAKRKDVQGRGSFLPALIDELGALTPDKIRKLAKIQVYPA